MIATIPAQGRGSRADWLQGLETDGATEVDAGAAEIVRDLRERCEGVDPRRR